MLIQMKRSLLLLVLLAGLFAAPIVTKTISAHGVVPALITGLLAGLAIALGPLAFVVARWLETELVFGATALSVSQWFLLASLSVCLVAHWWLRVVRLSAHTFPYLSVVGWAMIGATFCLVHLFVHVGG